LNLRPPVSQADFSSYPQFPALPTITPRAKPTANRVVVLVSGMFTWATKAGSVPDGPNPARGVSRIADASEVAMIGFHYPTRMAVLRLPGGGLFKWRGRLSRRGRCPS
jgi:hypothetical protein